MNRRSPILKWVIIPLVALFGFHFIFGLSTFKDTLAVMSIGFIFLVPYAIGALTVYFAPLHLVSKRSFHFLAPWVPILLFFILTLVLKMEGWACWLMVLPVFLVFASMGGIAAASWRRKREERKQKLYISLVLFLPFLVAPVEKMIGEVSGTYKAYTYIDIMAPKEKVWSHVTRVSEISEQEDKGWLTRNLGFPRPLRAELDYEGVGASREAIFSKGLVFHEQVMQYNHQKSMTFSIKANPYDIPSTTMDEHVVIGGEYFDVLNGTYELEQLSSTKYRLHLFSHFQLNTTFNFYASWWATWIMKDIQNNILQVIKKRCELSY